MRACAFGGKPLPADARADRLICSDACRSQLTRQKKQRTRPRSPSQLLRQELCLAQPVRFEQRQPTNPLVNPLPQMLLVDPAQWDARLTVLNLLYELYDELGVIIGWQGQTGHHYNPRTGDCAGDDVCGALQQQLADVRRLVTAWQLVKGVEGRRLAPSLRPLVTQSEAALDGVGELVRTQVGLPSPYQVVIPPELLQQLVAYQRWVAQWWFTLLDQP